MAWLVDEASDPAAFRGGVWVKGACSIRPAGRSAESKMAPCRSLATTPCGLAAGAWTGIEHERPIPRRWQRVHGAAPEHLLRTARQALQAWTTLCRRCGGTLGRGISPLGPDSVALVVLEPWCSLDHVPEMSWLGRCCCAR